MQRILFITLTICLITTISYSQPDYQKFIHQKPQGKESYLQQLVNLWKTPFDGSYAIIITIGKYDHFPSLEAAKKDSEKMKNFLLESSEYDEVVVLQDEDASFSTIWYFMQEYFPKKMRQGRYRLLFYFSGHGTQHRLYDDNIVGSLLLKGATGESGDLNAIDMRQIELWASRLQYANHILFLLDCCFSGLAGKEVKSYNTEVDPKELAKENGRFLITAGGTDETSIADLKRWGGSLFTDVVIHGMCGDADSNADGVVTTYELFSYVQAAVRNEAERAHHSQTPLISQLGAPYKDKGQYFFVYEEPTPVDKEPTPVDEEPTLVDKAPKTPTPGGEVEFGENLKNARAFYEAQRWEEAATYYYEASQYIDKSEIDDIEGLNAAEIYFNRGKFKEAVDKYRSVFSKFNQN